MTKRVELIRKLKRKIPNDPLRWYNLEAIVSEAFKKDGKALVNEFQFWDIVSKHSYWRIYAVLSDGNWELYDGNFCKLAVRPHPPEGLRVLDYLEGRPFQYASKERIPE